MPLSRQVYRMLFPDNDNDEGSVVGPRSILGMRVKREEVPFSNIQFEPKAQRYQIFDKWAGRVMAQPGIKNLFNKLGIRKRSSSQVSIRILPTSSS